MSYSTFKNLSIMIKNKIVIHPLELYENHIRNQQPQKLPIGILFGFILSISAHYKLSEFCHNCIKDSNNNSIFNGTFI